MNIRRFRALHAAGATYAEIARECGVDWRTVKKYLAEDGAAVAAVAAASSWQPAEGDHPVRGCDRGVAAQRTGVEGHGDP